MSCTLAWDGSTTAARTLTPPPVPSSLDCFFPPRFSSSSLPLPSLSSPVSLFSILFVYIFLSRRLFMYTFLSLLCCHLTTLSLSLPTHTHTHTQWKQLNSVGPLLLHYVNHHFHRLPLHFCLDSIFFTECKSLPNSPVLYICIHFCVCKSVCVCVCVWVSCL